MEVTDEVEDNFLREYDSFTLCGSISDLIKDTLGDLPWPTSTEAPHKTMVDLVFEFHALPPLTNSCNI